MIWDSEILYLHGPSGEVRSVRVGQYPDGMPIVDWMTGFRNVESVLLRPTSLASFVTALFWVDALVERGVAPPWLVLPFVPGARQDRLMRTGDFLFTAKSVAAMINARRFPGVVVLDPHSDAIAAMIDRCAVIPASNVFPQSDYAGVLSPDAGAEKRAGALARKLGVPLFHAWKTRDVATGKISGFGVQPLPQGIGRLLVVDDICDGGGTFVGLADALPAQVKADLFVTHGLFSKGTAPLLARFGSVFTTDSILGAPRDGVTVIQTCAEMLKGTIT